jgi:phospholipase C
MLLGTRVRANSVSRYPFDPSSIHQLLAWRFGLDPLGVRASDPGTVNLAYALNLAAAPRTDAPAIPVTQAVFGAACAMSSVTSAVTGIAQLDKGQVTPGGAVPDTAVSPAGGRFAELRAKADALGFPNPK